MTDFLRKELRRMVSVFAALAIVLAACVCVLRTNASAADVMTYKVTYSATKAVLTLTAKSSSNTIYYTTDGTKPTTSSKVYKNKLSASSAVTIRAIEVNKSGKTTASIKITIKPRVQKVSATVSEYVGYSKVKLTSKTSGATIYYTTDGSTPTNKSTKYTGSFKVTEDCTVKAIAYKKNMKQSKVTSKAVSVYTGAGISYVINGNTIVINDGSETGAESNNSTSESEFAAEVLRLVNIERANVGLSALTANSALSNAAQKRAEELVSSFSHTRPDGSDCFTVFDEYNVTYCSAAGENVAMGQRTPAAVVKSWMESDGHRANILSSKFTELGVGYYNYYWCQLFTG